MNTTEQSELAGKLGRDAAIAAATAGNAGLTLAADGAIPVDRDGVYFLGKGSAGAFTVAAPGAANIGRRISLITVTDFAHVTTFTGTTLMDGTAGLNTTWTAAAVAGCALTFRAVSATRWAVESFNLGTIAP